MEDCGESVSSSKKIHSEGPYRLLYCSSKGDRAGVIQELNSGVLPNLSDYDKRTALHLASSEGRVEIVRLLLEKGASVNSLDRWGRTVSCLPFFLCICISFHFCIAGCTA
ncbi:Integrin-linked protein kinase 1 [Linum perenne]